MWREIQGLVEFSGVYKRIEMVEVIAKGEVGEVVRQGHWIIELSRCHFQAGE